MSTQMSKSYGCQPSVTLRTHQEERFCKSGCWHAEQQTDCSGIPRKLRAWVPFRLHDSEQQALRTVSPRLPFPRKGFKSLISVHVTETFGKHRLTNYLHPKAKLELIVTISFHGGI